MCSVALVKERDYSHTCAKNGEEPDLPSPPPKMYFTEHLFLKEALHRHSAGRERERSSNICSNHQRFHLKKKKKIKPPPLSLPQPLRSTCVGHSSRAPFHAGPRVQGGPWASRSPPEHGRAWGWDVRSLFEYVQLQPGDFRPLAAPPLTFFARCGNLEKSLK